MHEITVKKKFGIDGHVRATRKRDLCRERKMPRAWVWAPSGKLALSHSHRCETLVAFEAVMLKTLLKDRKRPQEQVFLGALARLTVNKIKVYITERQETSYPYCNQINNHFYFIFTKKK